MALPHHSRIDIETTLYYHCVARCVRHAFLCGQDPFTGKNLDRRPVWIVERLAELAEIFCIRVCAYAIMSTHIHLVLRIDPEAAAVLTQEELARRHARLFPLHHARMRTLAGDQVQERMELLRARLTEISWFMRCLTEPISRRANREDESRGRFWEGRFKQQALLDDAALLTCMSHVDLSPVRDGIAKSLEGSDFTSIQQRLRQVARRAAGEKGSERKRARAASKVAGKVDVELAGFRRHSAAPVNSLDREAGGGSARNQDDRLPVSFDDYLALVQWAGQRLMDGNRSIPPADLPAPSRALLGKLGLVPDRWLEAVREFDHVFLACAGSEERIRAYSLSRGIRLACGARKARGFYAGDP